MIFRMPIVFAFIIFIIAILQTSCVPHQQQSLNNSSNLYQSEAELRLRPYFQRANISDPPQQITLLVFKQEKLLELWARDQNNWKLIKTYHIEAASGGPGPKLREGDNQVPEGVYQIATLNSHSHFHLSMQLDYPNSFDLKYAKRDGRLNPGTNIFIHGKAVSCGCIAIGDIAIEELFTLVYRVGINHTTVIIAPNDIRHQPPLKCQTHSPKWVPTLYQNIKVALAQFVISSPANSG